MGCQQAYRHHVQRAAALLAVAAALLMQAAPAQAQKTGSYSDVDSFSLAVPHGISSTSFGSYIDDTFASTPLTGCSHTGNTPAVTNTSVTCTSSAPATGASATASASIITSLSNGVFSAFLSAAGTASYNPKSAYGLASAHSSASVRINGSDKLASGAFTWAPQANLTASFSRSGHPVDFTAYDPDTGLTTTGMLANMQSSIGDGGSINYGMSGLILSGNAEVTIDMTSPYIPANEQGYLDLVMTQDVVTTSDGTGVFAGLLPAVGASGTQTLAGLGDFAVDYDLSPVTGDNGTVGLTLYLDATALVPEPATLVLLASCCGVLGLARHRRRV